MKKYLWIIMLAGVVGCTGETYWKGKAEKVLSAQLKQEVAWAMKQEPVTVTAYSCERSLGGIHDFYSEGDYWWPNPDNPDAPYIQRDGQSNPDNFVAHRQAMIRLSRVVGALAAAYMETGDSHYAQQAFRHAYAWFADTTTMMNPSLLYAQAIKGVTPGRGIGIIDTIHLMEVAQGLRQIEGDKSIDSQELATVKNWFAGYIEWLMTHPNSAQEMNTTNNHATCWVMQVASFAKLTGNTEVQAFCIKRFKDILLPKQMASDGSFPRETARTKPYGYSLFNLDAMATICQILSTPQDNLWLFTATNGATMREAFTFMCPYIQDKSTWPFPQDVMYWNDWPVAQPSLIFAAEAYNDQQIFDLWKSLPHEIAPGEIERNVPVRFPTLWM